MASEAAAIIHRLGSRSEIASASVEELCLCLRLQVGVLQRSLEALRVPSDASRPAAARLLDAIDCASRDLRRAASAGGTSGASSSVEHRDFDGPSFESHPGGPLCALCPKTEADVSTADADVVTVLPTLSKDRPDFAQRLEEAVGRQEMLLNRLVALQAAGGSSVAEADLAGEADLGLAKRSATRHPTAESFGSIISAHANPRRTSPVFRSDLNYIVRQRTCASHDSAVSQASCVGASIRSGVFTSIEDEDAKLRAKYELEHMKRESTQTSTFDEERRLNRFRRWCRRAVRSWTFEFFFAAAICCNSIWIGFEVDYGTKSQSMEMPLHFRAVSTAFTAIFLVEFLMRIAAEGSRLFCGEHIYWSSLDVFVVTASLFEVVLEVLADIEQNRDGQSSLSAFRVLRIIRITRLVRIIRVARIVRFVRALRTLVHSIAVTIKSLVWAVVLLMLIIYGFGVLFTQGVGDALLDDGPFSPEATQTMVVYWSSVPKSMLTLFMAISNGISWDIVLQPLGQIHPFWQLLFVFYIAFSVFAVLNVMTGVFCQSAIESAAYDQELSIQAHLRNKKHYVSSAKALFQQIDAEESGTITIQTLEQKLLEPKVRSWLESLDVNPDDAFTLFKLIDIDHSNSIDIEEFVVGCLRLKGPARSVDMARLSFEHRWLVNRFLLIMSQYSGNGREPLQIARADATERAAVPDM